jgi:hypothetical protein
VRLRISLEKKLRDTHMHDTSDILATPNIEKRKHTSYHPLLDIAMNGRTLAMVVSRGMVP